MKKIIQLGLLAVISVTVLACGMKVSEQRDVDLCYDETRMLHTDKIKAEIKKRKLNCNKYSLEIAVMSSVAQATDRQMMANTLKEINSKK